MQDEFKNSYDLFEVFKAHSRTNSSGILHIKWDENYISVILNEGKIIGVDSQSNKLSKAVLDRTGLTEQEVQSLSPGSVFDKTYQSSLVKRVGVLQHELEKIQKAVENEELQKLHTFVDGFFEFQLSIPGSTRNYLLNIAPGQLCLDLVQNGLRIAIINDSEDDSRTEDVVITEAEARPKVTDRKSKETIRSEHSKGKTTRSIIKRINNLALTPDGAKLVYFVSGLCLALFCGWKMPAMFSELVNSLSELVKI